MQAALLTRDRLAGATSRGHGRLEDWWCLASSQEVHPFHHGGGGRHPHRLTTATPREHSSCGPSAAGSPQPWPRWHSAHTPFCVLTLGAHPRCPRACSAGGQRGPLPAQSPPWWLCVPASPVGRPSGHSASTAGTGTDTGLSLHKCPRVCRDWPFHLLCSAETNSAQPALGCHSELLQNAIPHLLH